MRGAPRPNAKKQSAQKQNAKNKMGVGIAAGPHCRRCWHSRFPAPELTASFRRSLPFGSHPFGVGSSRSRFPVQFRPQAGSPVPVPPSVLRRPQFLTTWAWQSLVPLPQFVRFRPLCRCVRVSLFLPGHRFHQPGREALLLDETPKGTRVRLLSPSASFSVICCCALAEAFAASGLPQDASSASETGFSGPPSTDPRARLSTPKWFQCELRSRFDPE